MSEQVPFKMGQIPEEDQDRRGWELKVNGEPVKDVSSASLQHPKMGITVEYGKRPEGYDGFVIREPGGAATIPFMIRPDDGRIYVGLVTEKRPTMGEPTTDNIPRGFSDFKDSGQQETAEETAVREVQEETGYKALGSRLVKLAQGLNPNSTFFDYSRRPDEGVTIFALKINEDELVSVRDDNGMEYYSFPATVQGQAEGDKAAERILGSRFVPLSEALASRDMFTCAAAGQLLGDLLSRGEYIVPQIPTISSEVR